MSQRLMRTCKHCRKSQVIEFDTDGMGGVREGSLSCSCDARRRRGICMDCPNRVEGRLKVALRCAGCKKAVKTRRRWLDIEEIRVRQRGYWKKHKRRYNVARRPAARRYKHDYATKYVGIGCKLPTCRRCGAEVPFSGRGRPKLDCSSCRKFLEDKSRELGLKFYTEMLRYGLEHKIATKARDSWGGRRGTYLTVEAI